MPVSKNKAVGLSTGLVQPSEGAVFFQGYDIRKHLVAYKRRLGYVPEEALLYPYLSGREYLELVGNLINPRALDSERKSSSGRL